MEDLLLINNGNLNPAYNLALEEVLLTEAESSFFMLWRNSPAIIIGANQDYHYEVDVEFAKKHSIPIYLRKTGGGTVYHDLGTLNFSFIMSLECSCVEALNKFLLLLGVDDLKIKSNDVLLGQHKIIGTAQRIYGNKRLFHGSLLYDTNLDVLANVLTPDQSKLRRNGVASVAARVANLRQAMNLKQDCRSFMTKLQMEIIPKKIVHQGEVKKEWFFAAKKKSIAYSNLLDKEVNHE